jgi:hypothetical protein
MTQRERKYHFDKGTAKICAKFIAEELERMLKADFEARASCNGNMAEIERRFNEPFRKLPSSRIPIPPGWGSRRHN